MNKESNEQVHWKYHVPRSMITRGNPRHGNAICTPPLPTREKDGPSPLRLNALLDTQLNYLHLDHKPKKQNPNNL